MPQSRSAKAIILASGQALTTLVGLLSAAVLARLLSQADYGTYREAFLAYFFAYPFVSLGFEQAMFYFLPRQPERLRGVLVENLLLLSAGGVLLAFFLLLGGNELLARRFHNPQLAEILLLMAPYPLLMLPAMALNACLLSRERTAQIAIYNVTSRLLMFLAVLIPCLIWPHPKVAIVGADCAALVSTVIALVLMFRACPDGDWRPTWRGLRRIVAYSVPLGLAGLVATMTSSLAQVIVASRRMPEEFAVFVNGAVEIPLINIVTGSVTSVLIVEYARLFKEGHTGEIVDLIHRAMVKCALILIPTAIFLFCTAPEAMRVLFGASYEGSASVFRVYLLLIPIRTITFGAIVMATGYSRHLMYQTALSLLVTALLAWYAVGALGPIGAAVALVLTAYSVSIPYLTILIHRILKCPIQRLFPWRKLCQVIALSAVGVPGILLARRYLLPWSDVVTLLATGSIFAATTLALFAWSKFINVPLMIQQTRTMIGLKT
jgi:O-antigen/teichoic acid export membrane protein